MQDQERFTMISLLFLFFCIPSGVYLVPLPRKMVDLTHSFDALANKYPVFKPFSMDVVINGSYGSLEWLQSEEYSSTTHAGTHMDAPSHLTYGGKNIDQLPIESFIAPAAVIDITRRASQDPDAGATIGDLQNWEAQTGHSLDGTVVLLRSGWGSRYHDREAYYGTSSDDVTQMHFPGLEEDAAQWLVDNRRIVGIGTDTLSFDKGNSLDLNSHKILLGSGIYGLENIANLEQIPIYGATLYIMPMKIAEASGAPTRIIATFPEVIFHSDAGRNFL